MSTMLSYRPFYDFSLTCRDMEDSFGHIMCEFEKFNELKKEVCEVCMFIER